MTSPSNLQPVTTTTVRNALGFKTSDQVMKLSRAGYLPVVATQGRTFIFDPKDLAAIVARPLLQMPTAGTPKAIVVSTDGLEPDTDRTNNRTAGGWSIPGHPARVGLPAAQRLKAWEAWWNLGKSAPAAVGLPLVQVTSGVVGEVRIIEGVYKHSTKPGRVWLHTVPAGDETSSLYLGGRFKMAAGAPWVRLFA